MFLCHRISPIKSHVCVSQKLVWIHLPFGHRNPDTGGDDNFVSIQVVGASKPGQYALGESLALIGRIDRSL